MSTETVNAKEWFEKKLGPPTFAGYMRSTRSLQDLTQVEMAKKLKMSKSMLCDIEKGRQLVSAELAHKIAVKCEMIAKYAVQLALQDQLRKAKLKYTVHVA